MNNSGQIPPPFFGSVGNMTLQQGQPPTPFVPNIPPPNFSVPPPNIRPPGNFPRFSGPMYNQPTFNPAPGGCNTNVPPPLPVPHMLPPVYNLGNSNNNNNMNRGGRNQGSKFNSGQGLNANDNNNNNNLMNSNIFNTSQQPNPSIQPRQMPNLSDDIFSNGTKDVPCSFPHFKPSVPPPLPQNGVNPPQMNPMQHQRGGLGNRGGGSGRGFHQGHNSFHNNNNNNNFNYNNNHNNSNNNNSYNNNRGRGGFRGGMNNRGGYNNNNNKGRGGNNNNGRQEGVQKKKEKVDKRDLPENNVFFCDTCDRGYKTIEMYRDHISQHTKCSYKDCPFVAAEKVVQLHMNMQHRSGLAKKIYSLKTEEDVKKWKEERRKNYPTAENMKKKKEKMEERVARGEVIETKEFGKMKGKSQRLNRTKDRGRGRGGRFGHDRRNGDNEKGVIDEDEDGPPEERKIERSRKEDEKDEVDLTKDTNSDEHNKSQKPVKENVVDLTSSPTQDGSKNKGLSLLSGYGSVSSSDSDDDGDDDDGDEKTDLKPQAKKAQKLGFENAQHTIFSDENDETDNKRGQKSGVEGKSKTNKIVTEHAGSSKDKHISNKGSDGSSNSSSSSTGNGESATTGVSSAPEVKAVKRGHVTKGGPPDKKPKFPPKPPPKSYTLLEKLLAKEIRRERNKILQCIHFIVKNKFFDSNTNE